MIFLECEVCGSSGASKIAELEGSELRVCEDCSSLGTVKSKARKITKNPEQRTKISSGSSTFRVSDKVLKRDYGKVVRKAREDSGLTMRELSENISEKESVVRRIENERLKPGGDLSKKIERELDIDLFEKAETGSGVTGGKKDRNLTIGDVAKVK